jgi:hypothetical protein
MRLCPTCHQPITEGPRLVCGRCLEPIKRGQKWHHEAGRSCHDHCPEERIDLTRDPNSPKLFASEPLACNEPAQNAGPQGGAPFTTLPQQPKEG